MLCAAPLNMSLSLQICMIAGIVKQTGDLAFIEPYWLVLKCFL